MITINNKIFVKSYEELRQLTTNSYDIAGFYKITNDSILLKDSEGRLFGVIKREQQENLKIKEL